MSLERHAKQPNKMAFPFNKLLSRWLLLHDCRFCHVGRQFVICQTGIEKMSSSCRTTTFWWRTMWTKFLWKFLFVWFFCYIEWRVGWLMSLHCPRCKVHSCLAMWEFVRKADQSYASWVKFTALISMLLLCAKLVQVQELKLSLDGARHWKGKFMSENFLYYENRKCYQVIDSGRKLWH